MRFIAIFLYFWKIFSCFRYDRRMDLLTDRVPVYELYGEHHWPTPDMVHCETIAARSELHNWHIRPHRHHGLFQILYLQQGEARLRIDDQSRVLCAGQILLVPQMCIHGFDFSSSARGLVITLAYPLVARISAAIADTLAGLQEARQTEASALAAAGGHCAYLDATFAALALAYAGTPPHRQLLLESLLGVLLASLAPVLGARTAPLRQARHHEQGHFGAFCRMIDSGFGSHRPVAEYARALGITAAHLNVLCRAAVNRSALELIHVRLLLEAKRSLVYTSMTVSVLSDSLGFADPAYFTRFFKRLSGFSPKAFRRHAKGLLDPAP